MSTDLPTGIAFEVEPCTPASPGAEAKDLVWALLLARTCAHPESAIHGYRSTRLSELFERIAVQEAVHTELAKEVSASLYNVIPTIETMDRRLLLRVRRKLHNMAVISVDELALLRTAIADAGLLGRVQDVLDAHQALVQLTDALRNAVTEERRRQLDALIARTYDVQLTDTLALSNQELFEEIRRFHRSAPRNLEQRPNLVRSLLRYGTRMALKTTPFGQLCQVTPCVILANNEGASEGVALPSLQNTLRDVQLNKLLLPLVLRHIQSIPKVTEVWPLEVNKTLELQQQTITWLATIGGIEKSCKAPAIDAVVAAVASLSGLEPTSTAQMLSALCVEMPEYESDDIAALLERLKTEGAVVPAPIVPEQDLAWPLTLAGWLEGLQVAEASAVAGSLRELATMPAAIEAASGDERLALVGRTRALMDSFAPVGADRVEALKAVALEDTSLQGPVEVCVGAGLQQCLATLCVLVRRLNLLSDDRDDVEAIAEVYLREYGDAREAVPLLEFYEVAFKRHFKLALRGSRTTAFDENSEAQLLRLGHVPAVRARAAARRRMLDWWLAACEAKVADTRREVHLSLTKLDELIGDAAHTECMSTSVSVFLQLECPGDEQANWRAFVPAAMMGFGFGKYQSRFLHLFARHNLGTQSTAQRSHWPEGAAEIALDSHFNANLHPSLGYGEISYPFTRPRTDDATRITVDALEVVGPGATRRAPCLRNRTTGARVTPLDLGFLTDMRRPGLFRLLRRLQPPSRFYLDLSVAAYRARVARSTNSRPLGVQRFPRLVIGAHVVVSRQQWICRPSDIPVAVSNALDGLLRALAAWRLAHGVPERVFVRLAECRLGRAAQVAPQAEPSNGAAQDAKPASASTSGPTRQPRQDDRKPQFIDFSSPLLVELFSRVAACSDDWLVLIEEDYPTNATASSSGGEGAHRIEFLCEIGIPGEAD
ncbi:lantibiotic dehydratase [Gemmatimonas sp.]|uniref:lantibiotic dehydratase n=1 Tax=Gemmatimonas sp. TaxID=1962908 RepID=UPI00286DF4E3|nr:lantibiotic dehydratase [Gemmatimonas sp.]